MEANIIKTGISCYNKIFSQTVRKEETQESVVPDTMPDISRILETSGAVLIRSKDISAGKLMTEANIAVNTIYLPDGASGVCCLEMNIPVYINLEDERITENSRCLADISLLNLSTKILNPRKVLVKAELCARMACYTEDVIDYCGGLKDNFAGINTQCKTSLITPISCVSEKTFVLTDEYAIPAVMPTAEDILSHRTQLIVTDIKFVGNKLVLKGEVKSSIMYDTEEKIPACTEFLTDFSQIIETNGAGSEPYAKIVLLLSGAYYEVLSDSKGRTISMEIHLVAQVVCNDKIEITYLNDAYSNKYPMEIENGLIESEKIQRQVILRESVRELLETPQPVQEILDMCAMPGMMEKENGKVKIPTIVSIVYKTSDGQLFSAQKKYDVIFDTEAEAGLDFIVQQVNVSDIYVAPAVGGAEVRLPVEITAQITQPVSINYINSISFDEENEVDNSGRPSLVILKAGADDDLWNVARENCSTVAAIMAANALETAKLSEKRFVLIPKSV